MIEIIPTSNFWIDTCTRLVRWEKQLQNSLQNQFFALTGLTTQSTNFCCPFIAQLICITANWLVSVPIEGDWDWDMNFHPGSSTWLGDWQHFWLHAWHGFTLHCTTFFLDHMIIFYIYVDFLRDRHPTPHTHILGYFTRILLCFCGVFKIRKIEKENEVTKG